MRKDRVYSSWCWRPEDKSFKNFGDEMGMQILRKLGYKVKWSPLNKADILTTGTILDVAIGNAKPGVVVWGSGAAEGGLIDEYHTWDVRALRGSLTSSRTLQEDIPLGDPAWLAPILWKARPKKYKIGVVRHYVDTRDYPMADVEILATWPVEQVIKYITSCEFIISSSLHGLIIAQSYGIPSMRSPHEEIISGDWKYVDYMTAMDKSMNDIQQELIKALEY